MDRLERDGVRLFRPGGTSMQDRRIRRPIGIYELLVASDEMIE